MPKSTNKVPRRGGGGLPVTPAFFAEKPEIIGQYDWSADLWAPHQQKLANDIEDLTKQRDGYPVELWSTKNRFEVFDYSVIPVDDGMEERYIGACLAVPGCPVVGITELKCRTNYSTSYPTTVVDTQKMIGLASQVTFTGHPCWIIFRFQDQDMYYPFHVQQQAGYKTTMSRNRATAGVDCPQYEFKSVTHIPVSDLYVCHPMMFNHQED